ncbi:hypothetical protein J4H86_07835 [Spiractinospora alimapuensis]|uniref:hypothetical protein n=1 Tax=Spiractinospora alimapuensis TaxID=2820884 RepID=UPI001F2B6837|nr:hypothetical protein [Spiractinospora alimapuensis]QVQ53629.1 hypothetical protein J4H86_07835 [Spiractinospora alimapuensis]
MRAASLRVTADLGASDPDVVYVVGAGAHTREHPPRAAGTLRGFGVDVRVGDEGPARLPLALTLGAWLLRQAGVAVGGYLEVAADEAPDSCARWGRSLAGAAPRVAILALGDGSARRGESAPGYVDTRAPAFDARVAEALGSADVETLAGLDPELCSDLWVAGRPAWQVAAGAAAGGEYTASLLANEAPYGVGYFVASWCRGADGAASP